MRQKKENAMIYPLSHGVISTINWELRKRTVARRALRTLGKSTASCGSGASQQTEVSNLPLSQYLLMHIGETQCAQTFSELTPRTTPFARMMMSLHTSSCEVSEWKTISKLLQAEKNEETAIPQSLRRMTGRKSSQIEEEP